MRPFERTLHEAMAEMLGISVDDMVAEAARLGHQLPPDGAPFWCGTTRGGPTYPPRVTDAVRAFQWAQQHERDDNWIADQLYGKGEK